MGSARERYNNSNNNNTEHDPKPQSHIPSLVFRRVTVPRWRKDVVGIVLHNVHRNEIFLKLGTRGEGEERLKAQSQTPTRKTKAAVDRRQNNKILRQCPFRNCAATNVPRIYCPKLLCGTVTKTMSVLPLLENN